MKKRMISLLLILSLLLPMIPAIRAEEKAAADPYAAVEEQLRAYAASLDQSDAVSSASAALAIHGITMGGKKLTLSESSALTAVLLNSNHFQVAVRDSIVAASEYMRTFGLDTLPFLSIGIGWSDGAEFSAITYLAGDRSYNNWDAKLLDSVALTVSQNDYDEALEWMVGAAYVNLSVTKKEITENEVTYAIVCTITDRFDFHTSLSEGFKQWMSGIGEFLFREFDWEIRLSFELTVPYSCDHTFGSYHWSYDAENLLMNNDASEGFAENQAEQRSFINSAEKVCYYHELQNPVRLVHDKPWVMEYEVRKPGSFSFAPFETYASRHPFLYNRSRLYLLAEKYEFVVMSDEELRELGLTDNTQRRIHDYGTATSDLFTYSYKKNYTIRLENKILPDSGNMVYVTVYDENQDVVLDVPMDDYYLTESWGEKMVPQSTDSNGISGLDFIINFIGNKTHRFSADYFDLRIWENGEGSMTESAFSAETIEPTCTKDGGVVQICALCGYYYYTDAVPAYGHSYTSILTAPTCTEQGFTTYTCHCGHSYAAEYTDALGHDLTDWSGEISCTEGGTEERHCRRCGFTETRTVEATGHRYESTVIAPGCTEGGYTLHTCANCGSSYKTDFTNPNGHSFGGWYVAKEATLLEEGIRERACAACGKLEQRPIPKLENTFTDVKEGDYFYIPVLWAVDRGIPNGTSVTRFSPDKECTRAQVVTFLWRAAGCPEPQTTSHSFVDLKPGEYYEKAVLWAVEKGITNGTSPTTFRPDKTCTRGQVVTFLWRAAEFLEPESDSHPFTDLKPGEYYEKAVLWAVENGITNGTSPTTFSPDKTCTRGQVVTFLYRANN